MLKIKNQISVTRKGKIVLKTFSQSVQDLITNFVKNSTDEKIILGSYYNTCFTLDRIDNLVLSQDSLLGEPQQESMIHFRLFFSRNQVFFSNTTDLSKQSSVTGLSRKLLEWTRLEVTNEIVNQQNITLDDDYFCCYFALPLAACSTISIEELLKKSIRYIYRKVVIVDSWYHMIGGGERIVRSRNFHEIVKNLGLGCYGFSMYDFHRSKRYNKLSVKEYYLEEIRIELAKGGVEEFKDYLPD